MINLRKKRKIKKEYRGEQKKRTWVQQVFFLRSVFIAMFYPARGLARAWGGTEVRHPQCRAFPVTRLGSGVHKYQWRLFACYWVGHIFLLLFVFRGFLLQQCVRKKEWSKKMTEWRVCTSGEYMFTIGQCICQHYVIVQYWTRFGSRAEENPGGSYLTFWKSNCLRGRTPTRWKKRAFLHIGRREKIIINFGVLTDSIMKEHPMSVFVSLLQIHSCS